MSNSNSSLNLQSQAYSLFQQRKYQQSYNIYLQCLKQPAPALTLLSMQTTMAVLLMHMHDYAQAHEEFMQIAVKLGTYKRNEAGNNNSNEQYLQYMLIALKVELSLMLIQLVNANYLQVHAHLDKALQTISLANQSDKPKLWSASMTMVFGFRSFKQIYESAHNQLTNNKVSICRHNNNSSRSTQPLNNNKSLLFSSSPLLLTCLSLLIQMQNSLQLSFELQQQCFTLCTESAGTVQVIPALISCRHLVHLCERLNFGPSLENYKSQFRRLMDCSQIYGISQQTLFRSYQQKIQIGKAVVTKMMQYQDRINKQSSNNALNEDITYLQWLHRQVIYKLQQSLYLLQTQQQQSASFSDQKQSLIQVLNTLSAANGVTLLSYMLDSNLVQAIIRQQQQKINKLCTAVNKVGKMRAWNVLVMLPPRITGQQSDRYNYQQINPYGKYNTQSITQSNNNYMMNVNNTVNSARVGNSQYREQYYKQQRYKKEQVNINNNNAASNNYRIDAERQAQREREREKERIMQQQRTIQQERQRQKQKQSEKQRQREIQQQRRLIRQQQLQKQRQAQKQRQIQKQIRQKQIAQREYYQMQERQQAIQRQNQSKRERQLRLRNQQRMQQEEIQKYSQFRSRQDNYVYSNQEQNYKGGYGDNINYRQPSIEERERDISRDEKKYQSNLTIQDKRAPRRKMQYASVIQKSPYNYGDQSPRLHEVKGQSSRIKVDRTERSREKQYDYQQNDDRKMRVPNRGANIQNNLNNSKLANHMNNVYLDSDSSRFVNPLEDFQTNDNMDTQKNPKSVINNGGKNSKIGVNSKIERREQNSSINVNNTQYVNTQKIVNNNQQRTQTSSNMNNVMSILKNQNSRIRNAEQEIQNMSASKLKKLEQQQLEQRGRYQTASGNSQINNNNNSRPFQNQIPSPIHASRNGANNKPVQPQQTNASLLNRSQQQVEFNNVDILIQPANNPANISNLTNRIIQQTEQQRNTSAFVLPANIITPTQSQVKPRSQILPQSQQPPIQKPSIILQQQQNQQASQIMRKTDSNYIIPQGARKLNKLTANSPYIRRLMKLCMEGQYFVKRHLSSDGGQEKFVQLTDTIVKWAPDQDKIVHKYQSYKLKDIKGLAYGKVSETFLKQCNKGLTPSRCFSLILQKRTLDLYCTDDFDPVIWLSGLSAALIGQTINLKIPKQKDGKNRRARDQQNFDVPVTLYTPGRVLWKRFLMRLTQKYIKPLKKQGDKKKIKCPNAYAIILCDQQTKKNKVR